MFTQTSDFLVSTPVPVVMPHPHLPMQFSYPLPYGAIMQDGGVRFVVYSHSATAMRVLLYRRVSDQEPSEIIEFHPQNDRWGDIWNLFVPGLKAGLLYHLQADGPFNPTIGHRFNGRARLIDPYARALAGCFQRSEDGIIRPPKCVVVDDTFDWQGDRHLRRPLAETIIYELHVRGFTKSGSSKVRYPGTYTGVVEKIPYLKALGVTAVELMPIHEFPIFDILGNQPNPANYWGYDSLAFFSPHRGYMIGRKPGDQVRQFKEMVRELHAAGLEVILDVVFNHTAEGNEAGPVLSFKGLENRVYYMLNGDGVYKNFSGCGNTVNGNHPIVREMIFHCLRHWVHNYHIDGFRFDLASILSRDRDGELIPNPPLVEQIAEDPMLADTKIIAEAWDAAGAYQVGAFGTHGKLRWAEWNGRYRDDVRRYWRGDIDMTGRMATRLAGSSDLFQPSGRQPYHSINFITSHDGYTLNDLVSYERKHNEANLEYNQDGENNNYSSNYGMEGFTRRYSIQQLRNRQTKNFMATLFLSQGVPMILAGDEVLRTQKGNNNAWCQDNVTSWFHWKLIDKNAEMLRFVQSLTAFRRRQPNLRRSEFLLGRSNKNGTLADVSWFGSEGTSVNWHKASQSLVCLLGTSGVDDPAARPVLILLHAGQHPQKFIIPAIARSLSWRLFIDTAAPSPGDIYPDADGPPPPFGFAMLLDHHTLRCYVAK
ncbi:MAG: glycogen debranching protein GlgX [Pirellulales bacterium]|nr:glycogen debranching protein GlgX [Pirellulales bacterium]